MELLKVEGHSGLARDKRTGVILNIDENEIYQARQRKALRIKKSEEEKQLIDRLERVEEGINKVNNLILKLLEKENGL
jgi:hypothetical protein|tara:strand:- start:1015 stop:1248 length:234 start_codon:yes stop_codon:yes gene_type:complete